MAECFDWGYCLFRLSNDQGWLTICTCALWIHELSGAFGSRSCMLVTFSNHLLCHCDASAEIGKIRIELNPILLQFNEIFAEESCGFNRGRNRLPPLHID